MKSFAFQIGARRRVKLWARSYSGGESEAQLEGQTGDGDGDGGSIGLFTFHSAGRPIGVDRLRLDDDETQSVAR